MGYESRARSGRAQEWGKDAPGSKNGGYPESSAVPWREVGPAGFWLNDGGWCSTKDDRGYWEAPGGSMTRGVRQLVWLRRNAFPSPSPRDIAMTIEEHRLGAGFPNRSQWVDVGAWCECRVTTSAEAAVVKAGMGAEEATPEAKCEATRVQFYTWVMRWFLSQPVWPSWSLVEGWVNMNPFINPPDDWRDILAGVWQQHAPGTKPTGEMVAVLDAVSELAESA